MALWVCALLKKHMTPPESTHTIQALLNNVAAADRPAADDLETLLSLEDEKQLATLFERADKTRKKYMGEGILLRGLVEFSNWCANTCSYCGLQAQNPSLERYRLTKEQILESVSEVAAHNIKTVVLQSGEDPEMDPDWLADIIREIKTRFDMAITLSVGEYDRAIYKLWKDAGADRYLLKIETTDRPLYESLHPGMSFDRRTECLESLKELGYQTGSGIITGLPGQTPRSIAQDILFFCGMALDMIGIGPLIPHNATPLAGMPAGDPLLTLKTVALTRIVTKTAHIPATTALGSIDRLKDLRLDALRAGANVLMPNFTPRPYNALYEIYPGKRCIGERSGACAFCAQTIAASTGRIVDYGRGDAIQVRSKKIKVKSSEKR